jgi:hypothetical protein
MMTKGRSEEGRGGETRGTFVHHIQHHRFRRHIALRDTIPPCLTQRYSQMYQQSLVPTSVYIPYCCRRQPRSTPKDLRQAKQQQMTGFSLDSQKVSQANLPREDASRPIHPPRLRQLIFMLIYRSEYRADKDESRLALHLAVRKENMHSHAIHGMARGWHGPGLLLSPA